MSTRPIVYLMYHEIEVPGRPLCQSEPGYVRYIVRESSFREQMQSLQRMGYGGMSVPDALKGSSTPVVAITFDDGCETDLLVAAPVLKEAGFGATFYITVGFMGKPGYLTASQLRELSDLGFDIGCHSMTHPYLSDLDETGLRNEIAVPKEKLEQMTGRPVEHFSCPGGRWDKRVAEIARQAGFKSVATSRNSANSTTSDRFKLGRVAIMRNRGRVAFEDISRGRGLWRLQLADFTRASAKRVIGNAGYDSLRALLLGHKKGIS
jgi:peptidoglycan/xylan/chitin deacetylase (PgdA/CDA1 family)